MIDLNRKHKHMIDWPKVQEAAEEIISSLDQAKNGKSFTGDLLVTGIPDIREFSKFDPAVLGYVKILKDNALAFMEDPTNQTAWNNAYKASSDIADLAYSKPAPVECRTRRK